MYQTINLILDLRPATKRRRYKVTLKEVVEITFHNLKEAKMRCLILNCNEPSYNTLGQLRPKLVINEQ